MTSGFIDREQQDPNDAVHIMHTEQGAYWAE
jgi:hypothetical protein